MRNNKDNNNTFNILNLTFDDVKNNHLLMSDIRNKWSNLGFLENFEEGEKYDNLCIAFEQMSECLIQKKYDLNLIIEKLSFLSPYMKDEECENVNDFFEVLVFPIIYKLYSNLPLSDYDYLEILHALETIEIREDEIKTITSQKCDVVAELCALISKKINELISKKYND